MAASKVQIGQLFENSQSGARYKVYSITGSPVQAFPTTGEELLHLVLVSRPNIFIRADVFVTIPTKCVLEFFVPVIAK